MMNYVIMMARSFLGLLVIPEVIGALLIFLSFRSTTNNGMASMSINPTLFIVGILIAAIGIAIGVLEKS